MEVSSLETLSLEELIIIETRIKNSVDNLNILIKELKSENERLLLNNSYIKSLFNCRNNKKFTKLEDLLMYALGFGNTHVNHTVKERNQIIKDLKRENSRNKQTNSENCLRHFNNMKKLDVVPSSANSSKSYIGKTSRIQGTKKMQLINPSQSKNINDTQSQVRAELAVEINSEVDVCSHIENSKYSFEYGDGGQFKINLLIGENKYAKIRFCRFTSEYERSSFVKKITEGIGLKPIYSNCIGNLLRQVETDNIYKEIGVDIANLDPWED